MAGNVFDGRDAHGMEQPDLLDEDLNKLDQLQANYAKYAANCENRALASRRRVSIMQAVTAVLGVLLIIAAGLQDSTTMEQIPYARTVSTFLIMFLSIANTAVALAMQRMSVMPKYVLNTHMFTYLNSIGMYMLNVTAIFNKYTHARDAFAAFLAALEALKQQFSQEEISITEGKAQTQDISARLLQCIMEAVKEETMTLMRNDCRISHTLGGEMEMVARRINMPRSSITGRPLGVPHRAATARRGHALHAPHAPHAPQQAAAEAASAAIGTTDMPARVDAPMPLRVDATISAASEQGGSQVGARSVGGMVRVPRTSSVQQMSWGSDAQTSLFETATSPQHIPARWESLEPQGSQGVTAAVAPSDATPRHPRHMMNSRRWSAATQPGVHQVLSNVVREAASAPGGTRPAANTVVDMVAGGAAEEMMHMAARATRDVVTDVARDVAADVVLDAARDVATTAGDLAAELVDGARAAASSAAELDRGVRDAASSTAGRLHATATIQNQDGSGDGSGAGAGAEAGAEESKLPP